MLDFTASTRNDLRSASTPWDPRYAVSMLAPDILPKRADVIIIGAGITGALLAEHLSARGRGVLLLDREEPGLASTAASTAMLQWEIDAPLWELSDRIGLNAAAAVYQRSFAAVDGIRRLANTLRIPCDMFERRTLYLARGEAGEQELKTEARLRQRIGLPSEWLSHDALCARYGIARAAAVASSGSCEADPLKLAHGLLRVAFSRGAVGIAANVVDFGQEGDEAYVRLEDGRSIAANAVVLASGYAFPHALRSDLHSIASSWAIATKPMPRDQLWRERALIWDASKDYNYLRTTRDNRIVIGGEDENLEDAKKRDALISEKSVVLLERLKSLFPGIEPEIDYEWAGAFGETEDGLPLIGPLPEKGKSIYAAYGYGGNGITFSYMAARMIGAMLEGQTQGWFRYLSPDRAH